jgi:TRAP-type mannitol/chloroaromatic compound transport system permease large subunit
MMLTVLSSVFLSTILIGVPIAFGMGLAGAVWILAFEGLEPSILVRRMHTVLSSFPLLAIPLFVMIGFLAERCGMLPSWCAGCSFCSAGCGAAWRTSTWSAAWSSPASPVQRSRTSRASAGSRSG